MEKYIGAKVKMWLLNILEKHESMRWKENIERMGSNSDPDPPPEYGMQKW